MLKCATLASVALLALPSATHAWEHTVEWRFSGDEIASVAHTVPDFDEDPEFVEIALESEMQGAVTFTFEADNGVSEDCLQTLEFAQGNPLTTVVITVHLSAQTMNGSVLAQCSFR